MTDENYYVGTATYSPEDNKLRLYPFSRLDESDYKRVKGEGFIWAPKQELFVAPAWSPSREDLLLDMCGEIGEEDTTLAERAEQRSERFSKYSDNAQDRAASAKKQVESIADNIPFGQPILVGHHSEKRARRDAEKIENGMNKVVKELRQSEYWEDRARRTLRNVSRRERPDVIFRRIKTLETDLRKHKREREPDARDMYWWLSDLPKEHPDWSKEQISAEIEKRKKNRAAYHDRWIAHIEGRIVYERTLYAESGGVKGDTMSDKIEVGGQVFTYGKWYTVTKINRRNGDITSVSLDNRDWPRKIGLDNIIGVRTKAEAEAAGNRISPEEAQAIMNRPAYKPYEPSEADKIEESLKAGVKVVVANELFPTPDDVINRMFELAEIGKDSRGYIRTMRCLEPSAGTGAILRRLCNHMQAGPVDWCEIDYNLRTHLENQGISYTQGYSPAVASDFLEYNPGPVYDRILMNPPFSADIEHVLHAYDLLAPGGRLVSVMGEGPFFRSFKRDQDFRKWLYGDPIATTEKLPDDSFKVSGTSVATRLVIIKKPL